MTHSELIVRHLLMPGHVECCWRPVAEWLAENLPGVKVNLRAGFWPAWHAARHEELRRHLPQPENDFAFGLAQEFGIEFNSMKQPDGQKSPQSFRETMVSEILILPDGRILAHNLTPALAGRAGGIESGGRGHEPAGQRKQHFQP